MRQKSFALEEERTNNSHLYCAISQKKNGPHENKSSEFDPLLQRKDPQKYWESAFFISVGPNGKWNFSLTFERD